MPHFPDESTPSSTVIRSWKPILAVAALAAIAAWATPTRAATLKVGHPSDLDCDFSTVQDAVDEAESLPGHDAIVLANNQSYAGTTIDIEGHPVNLIGGFPDCGTFALGEATVLDGDGAPRAVVRVSGQTGADPRDEIVLQNLEIRGGAAILTRGGGIEIDGDMIVKLIDTIVQDNRAPDGGGIALNGGSGAGLALTEASGVFSNEASGDGGGIHCRNQGDVFVDEDSSVSFNTAGDDAGGISSNGCLMEIRAGGPFQGLLGNSADDKGGAMQIRAGSDVALLGGPEEPAVISGNEAGNRGGALNVRGHATSVLVQNARIVSNVAGDGGGIAVENGGTFVMERSLGPDCHTANRCSELSDNTATREGSDVAYGGAIAVFGGSARIIQTYVEDNVAKTWGPGGYAKNSGRLLLQGSVVASSGGGFSTIACFDNATLQLIHSTIASNAPHDAVVGGFCAEVDLANSILWDPGSTLSLWADSQQGTGNVFARCLFTHDDESILGLDPDALYIHQQDPGLVDPGVGNFHLSESSPAIDACGFDGRRLIPTRRDVDFENRGVDDPDVPESFAESYKDAGADERLPSALLFSDGFESGDTSAWSDAVGGS